MNCCILERRWMTIFMVRPGTFFLHLSKSEMFTHNHMWPNRAFNRALEASRWKLRIFQRHDNALMKDQDIITNVLMHMRILTTRNKEKHIHSCRELSVILTTLSHDRVKNWVKNIKLFIELFIGESISWVRTLNGNNVCYIINGCDIKIVVERKY